MNNYLVSLLLLLGISLSFQNVWADDDREEENEEAISRIDDQLSEKVGIVTAIASPGSLNQSISVFGKLKQNPEQTYQVQARFPGIIKSINYSIGDRVKKGALLAVIESNESLKTYQVLSPVSGLIVRRQGNVGESTQERQLFNISNFDTLWAEFQIYPAQQSKVHIGQTVQVIIGDGAINSTVTHVMPAIDKPYLVARVKLDNTSKSLSPGLLAKGKIHTRQLNTELAVEKEAVQELGGRLGVFVKEGEEYEFTPLILGQSDDQYVEVIDGLENEAEYVTKNSYLIKADILKSEAEDDD